MQNIQKLVPLFLVSAALGACGGGGGGDGAGSLALGAIDEANQLEVSGISYDSAGLLTSMSANSSAAGVLIRGSRTTFDLKSLIKLQTMEAMKTEVLPATAVGAVRTVNQACSISGTTTVALDDADNSASVTTGDKLTLVFNNCVTNLGGGASFTRNGTTSADFTKLTASEEVLAITFQNLAIVFPATLTSDAITVNLNGNLSSSSVNTSGVTTEATSVPSLVLASGSNSLTYTNYQLNESVNNVTGAYIKSGQGTISATGLGSFNLSTPVPFQGAGSGNPSVGKLKIVGSASTAYVTAIDTFSAKLDLDKGSDGTIEVTRTAAWGDF